MAASYPNNLIGFTRVADSVDSVLASHVNLVYTEVEALETILGVTPQVASNFSGTFSRSSAQDFSTVNARINNVEFGVTHALDTKVDMGGGSNVAPPAGIVGVQITAATGATANLLTAVGTSVTTAIGPDGWILVIDGGTA